jgi:hypothetical protein
MKDRRILWNSRVTDNRIHFPKKNPIKDNKILTVYSQAERQTGWFMYANYEDTCKKVTVP